MAEKIQLAPIPSFDSSKLYVWVKSLETKVNNLLREVDVIKNDFIKKSNELSKELKVLSDDFLEMKHQREKSEQKMDLVINELKRTAGKEEVMTLKKYLDLWNPLHFATQRDVERLIETQLAEIKGEPAFTPAFTKTKNQNKKE